MNKKDTNESNLLFPVPDSGDIASDVWRLILRNNAKMFNLLLAFGSRNFKDVRNEVKV